MITVLIADDHAIQRVGLKLTLELAESIQVLGEVSNAFELINQAVRLKPDVTLVDIQMPGLDGLEAIQRLKRLIPQTNSIALTCHDEDSYIRAALKAGANGYLLKDVSLKELIAAIESVAAGRHWLDSRLAVAMGQVPAVAPD